MSQYSGKENGEGNREVNVHEMIAQSLPTRYVAPKRVQTVVIITLTLLCEISSHRE